MWTSEDIRVASLLEAEFPNVHVVDVIHHEGQNMTETAPEITWDDEEQGNGMSEVSGPGYPELPSNPHNHVYTWSPKLPDGSMLVIRSNTADGLAEAAEAVSAVAGRLMAAWGNATGRQTPATPPPFGPNVSAPMAPGYQGPPVQQAPQWGAPQQPAFGGQQQGGFGGGAQQGNRQGPKPRPDWPMVYKINVPFQGKDAFKAFREQNKDTLRGKVAWAGGGDYWVHGDVAQGFAQWNPVAA